MCQSLQHREDFTTLACGPCTRFTTRAQVFMWASVINTQLYLFFLLVNFWQQVGAPWDASQQVLLFYIASTKLYKPRTVTYVLFIQSRTHEQQQGSCCWRMCTSQGCCREQTGLPLMLHKFVEVLGDIWEFFEPIKISIGLSQKSCITGKHLKGVVYLLYTCITLYVQVNLPMYMHCTWCTCMYNNSY